MKNILKTITFAFCLLALGSCEEDPDPIVSPNGFTLRTVDGPTSNVVLTPQQNDNNVAVLSWDKSDFGVGTTVSQYTVEIAPSGSNFANAITANLGNPVVTGQTYALTVKELNKILNELPTFVCGQSMKVDVRVRSVLGKGFYNEVVQYSSNSVALDITPFSLELPKMIFASTAPAADAAPNLAAAGVLNKDYEGYMYLQPGSYKFYKADGCGTFTSPVVYGDNGSGSFDGLEENGAAYDVATAGFYLVKASLSETSTYSVRPVIWNIYGSAKQNLPGANSALVYNPTTKLWTGTYNLAEGYGIKFRSNAAGSTLGIYDANSVDAITFAGNDLSYLTLPLPATEPPFVSEIKLPGTATVIRTFKRFVISLDLNNPRDYKYTIAAE